MKQAHLHHSEDLVLYDWAHHRKHLCGASEPLNAVQRICPTAPHQKLQPQTASHLIGKYMSCVCNTKYEWTMIHPYFVCFQSSPNTACNLLLGVTCFSLSSKLEDRKQIVVIACSDREYTDSHRFPLPPP